MWHLIISKWVSVVMVFKNIYKMHSGGRKKQINGNLPWDKCSFQNEGFQINMLEWKTSSGVFMHDYQIEWLNHATSSGPRGTLFRKKN